MCVSLPGLDFAVAVSTPKKGGRILQPCPRTSALSQRRKYHVTLTVLFKTLKNFFNGIIGGIINPKTNHDIVNFTEIIVETEAIFRQIAF